jgi:uncharacterized protein YbgA (DUF1722 family)
MNDDDTRDNFILQVMCHQAWRQLDGSFKSVLHFHEAHKVELMAQEPAALQELGRFLARGRVHFHQSGGHAFYYRRFFAAMKILVGRGRHVNVLERNSASLSPLTACS